MNPFAAFLQPPTQRSPLAGVGEFVNDIARLNLARQAQAQDVVQQKDSSARDWKRIGMQEAAQNRNFSDADKKEVESLLAEYQDAEDKYKSGEPGAEVRMSRATQMLKRFGMDVNQGPKAPPSLPGKLLPDVSAFAEQDLPQSDWEERLVSGGQAASASSVEEPDIAGHLKSVGPLKPLKLSSPGDLPDVAPTDLGDVDSPEFKAAADAEMGVEHSQQMADRSPAQLPGQLLPTVISKGGKKLYESTGPSGRYSPMVQSVFEPFTVHENPQIAEAAKSAQAFANKLIHVDGVNPAKAIEMARDQMNTTAGQTIGLERTKLGTRPRWSGTGGTGLMGKTQDIAESAQLYDDNARAEAAKIQEEDRQYESIEAAASSGDPALQRDAVNQLLKIRSGSAVTASEDARISQINGLIAQVQDRLGRWTGGNMTPEMSNTIRSIVAIKRQVSQDKIRRIYEHQAKLYQVQNRGKTKDPAVLEERARVLREGGNVGQPSNSDLYE